MQALVGKRLAPVLPNLISGAVSRFSNDSGTPATPVISCVR